MKLAVGLGAVVLALTVVSVVFAQYGGGNDYGPPASGVTGQLRTARTHASNAAGSQVLAGALDHLAHVVNCLEGPRGINYNTRADNPCQGQGNGVIPDLQTEAGRGQMGTARALELAREADRVALDTLKGTDLARVKTAATRVADLLGEAIRTIGQ